MVIILIPLTLQACKKAEAQSGDETGVDAQNEDKATDFFIGLEDVLMEKNLESICIVEINDPKKNDAHRIRNVRQATMAQLAQMVGITINEVSSKTVDQVLGDLKGTASSGLDPRDVMAIGDKLEVDCLLFASIESSKNDVFFWAYSVITGGLVFSDTLQEWKLPISKDFDFDLDMGTTPLDESV